MLAVLRGDPVRISSRPLHCQRGVQNVAVPS
jgi:hypothetical protein